MWEYQHRDWYQEWWCDITQLGCIQIGSFRQRHFGLLSDGWMVEGPHGSSYVNGQTRMYNNVERQLIDGANCLKMRSIDEIVSEESHNALWESRYHSEYSTTN